VYELLLRYLDETTQANDVTTTNTKEDVMPLIPDIIKAIWNVK
jgi:hypothetical protein